MGHPTACPGLGLVPETVRTPPLGVELLKDYAAMGSVMFVLETDQAIIRSLASSTGTDGRTVKPPTRNRLRIRGKRSAYNLQVVGVNQFFPNLWE